MVLMLVVVLGRGLGLGGDDSVRRRDAAAAQAEAASGFWVLGRDLGLEAAVTGCGGGTSYGGGGF
jgi:hypothetical protein